MKRTLNSKVRFKVCEILKLKDKYFRKVCISTNVNLIFVGNMLALIEF